MQPTTLERDESIERIVPNQQTESGRRWANADVPKTVDLIFLNQQHEILRDEFSHDAATFRDNAETRDEFVSRVEVFLDLLKRYVPHARTSAAADAVDRIASEWQKIFTTDLRIPKNIHDFLEMDGTRGHCEPTLLRVPSSPLRREVILERIRERAYLISKDWRMNWLKRLLYALNAHPERIHSAVLIPLIRTPEDDWHEACTCLACDVLEARIDLALQLSVNSFEFLDGVWLEDVKRLKAYLDWEAAQPEGNLDDAQTHYDLACREIRRRLLDPSIKAGTESFRPIANWIRDVVLDNGRIDTATRPYAHALVEAKARRLWERTKCEDQNVNWILAEEYVRKFYENLNAAVVEKDRKAVEAVLAATAACPRTQASCEIVNALEVALVTYFFKPAIMEPFFKDNVTYL